jgi:RNA 2',3'-cyclic 3'-phosphodiesterase
MRLFIGIELPNALKTRAGAAAARVRERVERAAPSAKVRWIVPANLHITIWFLGEVREPQGEALIASLKKPLDERPFTLRIGGAGAFPPSGAPRAIWLGIVAGREALVAIHDGLRPRLEPLGFEPEKRPYSPHLTIARVKDIRPQDAAAIRRVLREDDDGVGEGDVVSATLFVSRLTSTGSRYEVLLPILLQTG